MKSTNSDKFYCDFSINIPFTECVCVCADGQAHGNRNQQQQSEKKGFMIKTHKNMHFPTFEERFANVLLCSIFPIEPPKFGCCCFSSLCFSLLCGCVVRPTHEIHTHTKKMNSRKELRSILVHCS